MGLARLSAVAATLVCSLAAVPTAPTTAVPVPATTPSPTSLVVTAAADTSARAGTPPRRSGSASTLRYASVGRARAYVRFRLPAFEGTLTSAELLLTAAGRTPRRTVVSTTSATWSEHRLAWSTAPEVGARLGSEPRVRPGRRLSVDVTSAVTPGRPLAVVLTGSSGGAVRSSEAGEGQPRLRLTIAPPASPDGPGWQPTFPIRAGFYYPWFPEGWRQQGFDPFTRYSPALGLYDSGSRAVIRSHTSEMIYAGLHAGIASWWGPSDRTDRRFPLLLGGAAGRPFRWAVYYEAEGVADPSPTRIAADVAYVASHYGDDPAYLQVDGRPVVFVYADPGDGCAMAQRWSSAGVSRDAYVVLKDFEGYLDCTSQPDSWHQYAPAQAQEVSATSFSLSPGFWRPDEREPRLARRLARFASDAADMVASRKRWQLVTTWNEWGEGTAVEAAREWRSPTGHGRYVDILHSTLPTGHRRR